MKLEKKKNLVARTLGVGKNRIVFNIKNLSEVKESITKQDIRDLVASGAIKIREIKGRRKIVKRKTRRRAGSVKKTVKRQKREYMIITRKLRSYLKSLKAKDQISPEKYAFLRKEIRIRSFRSLAHMKEHIVEEK
ncbi:MAG: 50S ribosomal protein L19e [Nanoarchaeota archaeon]|nr:50S ribosomal protein L19e [Nanoarchaeota archaeon]